MKSARDPRHQKRRQIVKELFAYSFSNQNVSEETREIIKKKDILDQKIANSAPIWPIEKLNKIDLAILRLAVYELEKGSTPPKVIVDEAVELGKEFGSDSTHSFINGVLGSILNHVTTEN
ncbi:transcription antitermination factor NusB [Candidatus Woesebacteria bacterium RIFCSPHIGHO2_02_FULL_38_9]|uniref:Transcription antitermination factor NusB n=1 Tax=Candidatus Woesebacteria bacterium RIFCSPHIGHO2_01_FULL_39_28 TaxID=1802496 RepID=A0A1F7YCY5_9BACT|nr:MAG: transcription antitermination factor NusB [Candidatus Woesebacteria bacterium RIFCSPHIGHO2_01_FULL_39_28]OGM32394.1 MAG: transcription antitermination factor NusB [Candidatus Woesebacteria bacterium RIFCSPHIGHO2_02_FULL_38_9]OGM57891.1 MAG: transcription antitermination factor NusB [Candidatus Woesebacteria bacterium RIFCSPLOWO2_01_FULL_38_20]